MMIDYNVRDDWPSGEPLWMKSLVSSLDRRHRSITPVALPVIVQEIINWVALASGEEAWKKSANRRSLRADFVQSVGTLGLTTRSGLAPAIAEFTAAFSALDSGPKAVLSEVPGTRTDPLWMNLTSAGQALMTELASDASITSCWADLVDAAEATNRKRRDHLWFGELLFEQLRLRRLDPEEVFKDVVKMLAYGRRPEDYLGEGGTLSADERLSAAEDILLRPATETSVVVWLGYAGGGLDHQVEAGDVTFMSAPWFVPNARPEGPEFEHKNELSKIVSAGMFRVAELVTEESEVDILARVDLGTTHLAGAVARAENIVSALLNISIHWSGGVRPLLAQSATLSDGEVGRQSWHHNRSALTHDDYGRTMTAEAVESFAPALGAALAKAPLPMYLAAAVECQTAADVPHSRERLLQHPGEADMRAAVPLEDRVVQHVAAHAGMTPARLFELLLKPWAESRWRSDVELAVRICLLGSGPKWQQVERLQGQFYSSSPKNPWLVFVAENETALLDVCRVESEKSWIARMLRSVSDPALYSQLLNEYGHESAIIADRRTRTRNALVHGNPVEFQVVESVAPMASFLSRRALRVGLDSFVSSIDVETILEGEQKALLPLLHGTSVADYWRAKAATIS